MWQNVPTAGIQIAQDGQLNRDVTQRNVMMILDQVEGDCQSGGPCINPIIFDTDGRITDALLGSGASSSVAGFAGPNLIQPAAGAIVQGLAVFNGRFARNLNILRETAIHELGHFLGLDHSALNADAALDSTTSNDNRVPIMTPLNFVGPFLRLDDMAGLSWLYPNAEFQTRGTITGQIRLPNGVGFQGANVVARKVADPLLTAVSCVSGFLYRGSDPSFGSINLTLRGYYELVGLPPGPYTVEVEAINPLFTEGSGVGPLSTPAVLPGPPEFYSGDQESATDDPKSKVAIDVTPGSRTDNINIILNVPGNSSRPR
jgi:hypothetical protein